MKTELMALMVHDLKNPLAALLANLGFVASCVEADETVKEAVDDCLLSTEVLGRLVDNLSAINRLESGTVTTSPGTPVDDAVSVSAARMERHAAAAMLKVESTCDPDCGSVCVPIALLELALDNMMAAAMSLAPSGSTVRLSARRREGGGVSISVDDDGPPISSEMRPLLGDLEGQLQLKGSSSGRYARGLGLFVVRLIAELGGGKLDGRSREGSGGALTLTLGSG